MPRSKTAAAKPLLPSEPVPVQRDWLPECELAPVPKELKLMSWNVNGARAIFRKNFVDYLRGHLPDVLGIQETKARPEQLEPGQCNVLNYASFWNPAQKPGYSGTATFSRVKPDLVQTEFEEGVLNGEGRVVRTDFADITLLNVYFPNGKMPGRLEYKLRFYDAFLAYIERLRAENRRVVFCGDVNTAHREIDLARPKANVKTSGFMPIEREWIDKLAAAGWLDTLRMFHPETPELYTWWDVFSSARERNVGWRIDYFFVAPELKDRVKSAAIHPEVMGSDHCPVSIVLRMS